MKLSLLKATLLLLIGVAVGATSVTLMAKHHGGMSHGSSGHLKAHGGGPKEAGQAAFASIAEIVALLQADPDTDWSSVDISALRDHLGDMNALVMESAIETRRVENGLVMTVGGTEAALGAARRMLKPHSTMLGHGPGWRAEFDVQGDQGTWTVTSDDPKQTAQIQALGFYGILATGGHHQPHHLALATGKPMH